MAVTRDTLVEHLRFTKWATTRTLESAVELSTDELTRDVGGSFGSVLGTLIHTYCGDRMWWSRVSGQGRASMLDPGEEITPGVLQSDWAPLLDGWIADAEQRDEGRIVIPVRYRTTGGEEFETPYWQIVLHVVNHATYHRGQVSNMLRQLGRTGLNTDLMNFYRQPTGS